MTTYIYRPDHPKCDKFGFIEKQIYEVKSVSYYISDEMSPTKHMCSGKVYTSKKKFRNETRAYGCVEVGNDVKIQPRKEMVLDRRQRREDIKRSIYQIRNQ